VAQLWLRTQQQSTRKGSASPFTSEANALIDNAIRSLVTTGVWTKLDMLFVFAAHDAQAALVDWKVPSSLATLQGTGGPTFTTDRGFTPDGVDDYVDLNYAPATASRGLAQNDAHIGVRCLGTSTNTSDADYGGNAAFSRIRARDSSNCRFSLCTSTFTTFPADTLGTNAHIVAVRRDAENQLGFKNNAGQLVSGAVASSGVPGAMYAGRSGTTVVYSNRQIALVHCGVALTDQNVADVYSALNTYLQGVGAVA
jgi:hypothetical protein